MKASHQADCLPIYTNASEMLKLTTEDSGSALFSLIFTREQNTSEQNTDG